jgi:hypothetical protein
VRRRAITAVELVSRIDRLLCVVERRQDQDEPLGEDFIMFWEGYQAALHDLRNSIEVIVPQENWEK